MKQIVYFVFLILSVFTFAQENCFNGIDDNGNGLIDLNDPLCACNPPSITSIIPNPSFETYTSLPTNSSQLNLAVPWVQASIPTTDYLNTLGFVFTGLEDLGLVPFPNGNGAVGCFFENNWKEYLGTSLLNSMIQNTNYQLTFNVAASSYDNSLGLMENINIIPNLEPVNITIYGKTGLGNFPLNTTGDPLSFDPNWIILGQTNYNPESNWNELTINIISNININTIMLGAPVNLPISYPTYGTSLKRPYLLFDNLRLNTTLSFGATINNTGNFCENNLVLTASPNNPNLNYQWYFNGIAIPGATNANYNVPFSGSNIGEYKVRIYNPTECSNSQGFYINDNLITPTFIQVPPICVGAPLSSLPSTSNNGIIGSWSPALNNTTTTTYTFTPTAGQCASSTQMTIVVNQLIAPIFNQIADICSGQNITLPPTSLNGITGSWSPAINNTQTTTYNFEPTAGQCATTQTMTVVVIPRLTPVFNPIQPLCYNTTFVLPLTSNNGINGTWAPSFSNTNSGTYTFTPSTTCDLPISVNVTIRSDFDFDFVQYCRNENFILEIIGLNQSINLSNASYNWFYENNLIPNNNNRMLDVTNYFISTPSNEQTPYTLSVNVTNEFGCEKIKDIVIDNDYCKIQQGISPNGDNLNEFFDLRLLNVDHLMIYNRWGMMVYDKHNYKDEWTGQTNDGKILPDGTYFYVIIFKDNVPSKAGWIYINKEVK
jgi:gliding motility-associated-like protein